MKQVVFHETGLPENVLQLEEIEKVYFFSKKLTMASKEIFRNRMSITITSGIP